MCQSVGSEPPAPEETFKTVHRLRTDEGHRSKGELVAPAEEEDVVEGLEPEDGEVVEIQDEDVEPLKIAPSPIQPSQADVEEHRLTHVPYRS